MEENLSSDLSILIGKYGAQSVHKAVMSRMKDDYSYFKKIFDEAKEKVEKPVEKPVDKPVEKANEIVKEVVEVQEVKFRDPKEMKAWQRTQEEIKKKENDSKGIKKETLLTKENLKKWIEEEGHTFSYISRTYVGCKDSEVSATAKLFGIDTNRKHINVKTPTTKK